MRVLFTSQPWAGHWHPLVPLARALEQAGHEVAFANTPDACTAIEANGFRCFRVGRDETPDEVRVRRTQMDALPFGQNSILMWPSYFAGLFAQRNLPDLVSVLREWRPDVLVRDMVEFAGCVAAEHLGIPHAAVQLVAFEPRQYDALIAPPLNELRASLGMPPDPELEMLYRYLLLSPLPLSFHDPAFPLPPTTHPIAHVGFDQSGDEHLPDWVEDLPDLPTVYATLGTMNNRFTPILQAIFDGLRGEPVNLILTIGRDRDPAEFAGRSGDSHAHVERYIPQSLLLPKCDLVISHGGSGTVKDALSLGLPMVVIPIGADQPANALRCEALGVARVIEPDSRTPEAIREAVKAVLGDPQFRQRARAVGDEMRSLPGLDYAVGLLERLGSRDS